MKTLLLKFAGSLGFGVARCMAKCPNCDKGACSKDVGHAGTHYCNYDEKPF